MTTSGIWSYRLAGIDVGDSRVQNALNWLDENEDLTFNSNYPYYFLSFAKTMAMCFINQNSQGPWYKWYDKLASRIASLQSADGSWNQNHGQYADTAFCILALQTVQPPAEDLWLSIILHSPAHLAVSDPQNRTCDRNICSIPDSSYSTGVDGSQKINLGKLEAGHYKIILNGTGNGLCDLEINGYRGDYNDPENSVLTRSLQDQVEIEKYQVLSINLLLSSMVGELTIHTEKPEIQIDPTTGKPLVYEFDESETKNGPGATNHDYNCFISSTNQNISILATLNYLLSFAFFGRA